MIPKAGQRLNPKDGAKNAENKLGKVGNEQRAGESLKDKVSVEEFREIRRIRVREDDGKAKERFANDASVNQGQAQEMRVN